MADLIEIGIIAYLDPKTGNYSDSIPIYREKTPKLAQALERRREEVYKLLAEEYDKYCASKISQSK